MVLDVYILFISIFQVDDNLANISVRVSLFKSEKSYRPGNGALISSEDYMSF